MFTWGPAVKKKQGLLASTVVGTRPVPTGELGPGKIQGGRLAKGSPSRPDLGYMLAFHCCKLMTCLSVTDTSLNKERKSYLPPIQGQKERLVQLQAHTSGSACLLAKAERKLWSTTEVLVSTSSKWTSSLEGHVFLIPRKVALVKAAKDRW